MNRNLSIVFSIFLLVGIIVPAYAQTAENVVINEVEINPPGDDSASVSEWVELYNPTDSEIDLSGWQIASTTVLKKTMIIPPGTTIEPGQFLTFSYQTVWFTDSMESVELRNENGVVLDKTPILADIQNDFTSWQRIYDGYDLDNSNDWKFVTSTSGSANGKLIETQETEEITVTITSSKSSYLFGETAVIDGSVSKEVNPVQPEFLPEPIIVHIVGPDYDKIISLYPDLNLNYDTTLNLHQVLGINEGTYDVTVTYADAIATTSFSVGNEIIVETEKEIDSLNLSTEKSQYLPGESVTITGFSTEIIEFQGMKFVVTDPNGGIVYNGNLFPTNGEFKTSIFISTVSPIYGTYEIIGEYFDKSAITSFEVVADVKEDVPISLWTDKDVYGLGDVVTISGRLNDVWVDSVDLEILQTTNLSLGVEGYSGGGSLYKILDSLRPEGDGKFQYTFTIPDGESRFGDYRIKISKDIGSVTKSFVVVENPETYVPSTEPLTIHVDKSTYDFSVDKQITITGHIAEPVERTSFEVDPVKIKITTADGSPLEIIGLPEGAKRLSTGGISVGYELTAIPEPSGRFNTSISLERLIFSEGTYLIEAQYVGELIATTSFEVVDLLTLNDPTIRASLNKDVFGLGEKVKLDGILSVITYETRGIDVTLYKPGGDTDKSGIFVNTGGLFSWEWTTPVQEKTVVIERDRSETPTNLGIYRIHLENSNQNTDLFFKVSLNPEDDELVIPTLSVSTSKSLYKSGEQLYVEGTVNKIIQGDEGLVVPHRVLVQVIDGTFPFKKILESSVYPDQGGLFKSDFDLPITVFSEGIYKVKAIYDGKQTEHFFSVVNDFAIGNDDPVSLVISTDKNEYYPGDIVTVSGIPNKLIYLETYDVSVIQKSDSEITCGSFICGTHLGSVTSIYPTPTGSFSHQFEIPKSLSSIGTYEITVDADFETKHIQFTVVEEPTAPKLETVIEKENRIPDIAISVSTQGKTVDDVTLSPRVVSGSLLTPIRDDTPNVNLKVSSQSGVCIIGPDADCLVSESTRKPGQIYDVVEVDGMSLNVRYSGPDVRLEKFSILPESSDSFLPDSDWNVEILKDEQVSRFYYKVTYKALE